MRFALIVIGGTMVAVTGVLLGAWWAPYSIGLVVGLLEPRARLVVPLGAGFGFVAWLLPMLAAQVRYGLGPAATSLAAIMGFRSQGAVPVILTLTLGLLLGLCGAWLGSAARKVAASAAR